MEEIIGGEGLESFLLQYVMNAADTFAAKCPNWVFSCATDKGAVNALPLQNTIFALAGNDAWLATPAVPSEEITTK